MGQSQCTFLLQVNSGFGRLWDTIWNTKALWQSVFKYVPYRHHRGATAVRQYIFVQLVSTRWP